MSDQLARWISILAHPFVMVSLLVVVPALRRSSRTALQSLLLIAAAVLVPLGVLMFRQVRRGAWTNVDASNASERPVLFVVALLGTALALAWLLVTDPHSWLVHGMVVTAVFLGVAMILTRWIKLSLHVAFAANSATALSLLGSPIGYALVAAIPLLIWSRLALSRHRPLEIIVGLILGSVTGFALVRL